MICPQTVSTKKTIKYLLPLFAVATLFPQLFPGRVQLTELIFLVAVWCFRHDLWSQIRKRPLVAGALVIYCGVNLLSAICTEGNFLGADAGAMEEAVARCYLGLFTFVAAAHVARFGTTLLEQCWKWATGLICITGILVFLVVLAGGPRLLPWLDLIPGYPYLGDVYRLRGPAPTFGMFFMLLLPGLFLAWRHASHSSASWWWLVVIGMGGALTLGKELLLLPIGVLLFLVLSKPLKATDEGFSAARSYYLLGVGMLSLLLMGGTHILPVQHGDPIVATAYTSGKSVASLGNWELLETNYTSNKRAAWLIGHRNPWLGVGPGNFAASTLDLVATGDYPKHFGRFDSHSAYWGALSETGWLGLTALLLFIFSLLRLSSASSSPLWLVLLLLFFLAAIFKDVMNFRGLWECSITCV